MRIFIDPHKDGCTVWFDDGNVQTLRGTHEEILERIRKHTTHIWKNASGERHIMKTVEVFVDSMGNIGAYYFHWLDNHHVDVKKCTYKHLIK